MTAPAPSCAPGEVERLAAHKAAEATRVRLRNVEKRTGRSFSDEYFTMAVVQDALAALSPQGLDAKEGGE